MEVYPKDHATDSIASIECIVICYWRRLVETLGTLLIALGVVLAMIIPCAIVAAIAVYGGRR